VEEAGFDLDATRLGPSFLTVYSTGLATVIDGSARATGREPQEKDFEAMTWNFYQRARQFTGSQYLMAVAALQRVGRAFAGFFENYDLWLTPSLGSLPLPVGTIDFNDPTAKFADRRIAGFALYNPLYNLSGQPAITLPLAVSKDGLPIGMMFGGRYGDEATLLQLAGQLEAARPWISRRAKVQ
jgi:Asp-tRNA(Asn)/Glu-tRNA(Gln) amidotransferase A subunit family amidase